MPPDPADPQRLRHPDARHLDPGPPGSDRPQPGTSSSAPPDPLALPSITLPKGGGAIRGIDEKLTVGLATGAATLSVPLAISPGRQGFGPELALTYDSGAGNGPFGLGWRLASGAISRKTSRGLPRYEDADDSDVFVLSDAEDLVPLLVLQGDQWVASMGLDPSGACTVRRYRPRVEAGFARVERWQDNLSGDVHWRTVSAQNVTTLFGQTPRSRISDPADPSRVFSWLLDCRYDDRGNALVVEYKPEDSVGVPGSAHENGRKVGANRYLKRVYYGNIAPYQPGSNATLPSAWFFELVVDYGEHDLATPQPTEATTWPCRVDPFSTYRSCFELRTYRLGRRVLMFHRFPDGLDTSATLVRSTDLTYATDAPTDPTLPAYSLLTALTHKGYIGNPTAGYTSKQLPTLAVSYAPVSVHDTVAAADADALANLPSGVDAKRWRWSDLDGEGLQGVLADDDQAWYFKRNLSAYSPTNTPRVPCFEPLAQVVTKPLGTQPGHMPQLVDLHGDGHLCAVEYAPPMPGYFARDGTGGWLPFTPFQATAAIDWSSPNLRTVDLDGDGLADLLITDDDAFTWYAWLAGDGFAAAQRVATSYDENAGPALVFAEGDSSIYLADMSGDGLADLVRIRNGDICYWPNLGFGRFGAKVIMDAAPWFDTPECFDAQRALLADIDGSGTADLIYLGTKTVTLWFNQSGNSYSAPTTLTAFPDVDATTVVVPIDLLGTGTTCLVWSSLLPGESGHQLRYVDLMGGIKPHLLTTVINNMGAETTLTWAPSTQYYVEDLLAGHPWATRLPFPVHVVANQQVIDRISATAVSSTYTFHHGYFDPVEREFRGFARVDQTDTDSLPAASGIGRFTATPPTTGDDFNLPPVLTRNWFHTGAYLDATEIAATLAQEYFDADPDATPLALTRFDAVATPEQMREQCRALRGRTLRTEIYALDGTTAAPNPYLVTEHRYQVHQLQPPNGPSYGSYYACGLESLSSHYERNPADPRLSHELTLAVDAFGNVTRSATAAYPRRHPAFPEQAVTLLTYSEHDATNVDDQPGWYRIGLPVETRSYELTGVAPTGSGGRFDPLVLNTQAPTMPEIAFTSVASGSTPQKRLVARERTIYRTNDLSAALPIGQVQSLALVDRSYRLTMTPDLVSQVFATTVGLAQATTIATGQGGYIDLDSDGSWWAPSPRVFYSPDPLNPDATYASNHFYLAQGHVDPFAGVAAVAWENDLAVVATTDPVGNTTSAIINYRILQPWLVTDPNANRSGARFDALAFVTASAAMGKAQAGGADEGDHLDLSTDESSASDDPTTTFDYDRDAYATWADDPAHDPSHPAPLSAHSRVRVRHKDPSTPWLETYRYVDGFGRVALSKAQAEPGIAPRRATDGSLVRDSSGNLEFATTDTRWVGTGRIVYDNKANPIKAYEPFFDSSPVYDYETDLVEVGVTPIIRYDPLSRQVRVDQPDGSFRTINFDAWTVTRADEVDNVLLSSWYSARVGGGLGPLQSGAATEAAAAANTPAVTDLDTLGRVFRSTVDNGSAGLFSTRLALDISGRVRATTDALSRVILTQDYALPGTEIHRASIDAGERWVISASDENPLVAWDSRDIRVASTYDAARRPIEVRVTDAAATDRLMEQSIYAEGLLDAVARNLRGCVYQRRDQAGVETCAQKDFDGNVITSSRQLLQDPVSAVDWDAAPGVEAEIFATTSTYDALKRPITVTTPDASVSTAAYNPRSLLASLSVNLRGALTPTSVVTGASYDPKGQRQSISHGNGATTTFTYDPETFRLVQLQTVRPSGASPLQDLAYVYDPVGNVTHISDTAQATNFFANQVVSPDADFTYDAIYRLVKTEGREHLGQAANPQTSWDDSSRVSVPLPSDGQAMGNYTETYEYDSVGNLQILTHMAAVGSWSRSYAYDEPAATPANNRLTSTTVGANREAYAYDANGNIAAMPQLSFVAWDFKNRLQASASQLVNVGNPETTYYAYDQTGKRIRKITNASNGSRLSARVYLGAYEVYREYSSTGVVTLERQSLHMTEGAHRLCLIETTTLDAATPAAPAVVAIRFQLGNLIGSSVLELDISAAIISYEEYFPYGATSFQAGRSQVEVSLKRYRYTGKERDAETGLSYHGARYYVSWLARWMSCDPAGIVDAASLYVYVKNNPIASRDPTGRQSEEPPPRPEVRLVPPLRLNIPAAPLLQPSESTSAPPPSGGPRSSAGSVGSLIDRPVIIVPSEERGGRSGDSDASLENLTLGNTAGGATQQLASESTSSLTGNVPGARSPLGAGATQLVASRFAIGAGSEAGILLGTGGALSAASQVPPHLLLGTLHLALPGKFPALGIFVQAGAQRDQATGQWTHSGAANIAATIYRDNHQTQIYPNVIVSATGTGQVSNRDVRDYVGVTALLGVQRSPENTHNVFGAEIAATFGTGQPLTPGGATAATSGTLTVLGAYQRSFASSVFGVAAGVSAETGGGGVTAFVRVGFAFDRPITPFLHSPGFEGGF